MCRDFERILEENSRMTRKKISPSLHNDRATDISGTKDLFLMAPLTIIGGRISGYPSKSNIQDFGSLFAKEHNVVIQGNKGHTINNYKRNQGHQNATGIRTKNKTKNKCNAKHGSQHYVFESTELRRAV